MKAAPVVALGVALWVAFTPSPAQAEDAPVDPLLAAAIVETGAGGVLLVVGALVMVGARTGPNRCGVAGCVGPGVDDFLDSRGSLMVGAGLGLATVGGLTWLGAAADPLETGEERDSIPGVVVGSALVGVGAASSGMVLASSTAGHPEGFRDAMLTGTAISTLAVGIPLLASSADSYSQVEREEEAALERGLAAPGPRRLRSPAMLNTGITLTVVGGIAMLGGGAIAAVGATVDLGAAVGGGVTAGAGLVLLGVGIPLTVVGAKTVPDRSSALPSLTTRIGPGSFDLTATF